MFGVWSVEDTKKEFDKRAACVATDMDQFTAEVDIFGLPDKCLLNWMVYLVFVLVYLVFLSDPGIPGVRSMGPSVSK